MCLNHWDPGLTASIATNHCTEQGLLVAGPWPLENIDLVDDGEKSYPAGLGGRGGNNQQNFTVESWNDVILEEGRLPNPKDHFTAVNITWGSPVLSGGQWLHWWFFWELCLIHMELVGPCCGSEICWSPYKAFLVSNSRNHWWTDAGFLPSTVWSATKLIFSSRECHHWNFKAYFSTCLCFCAFLGASKFVFYFHHLP